jgi:predicted metal-dependent phosphoesterase TrpH/ABC-type cobalamin/Fe3+-siderophores transport system ATPase subunit
MSAQQYPGSRWWKFDFHNHTPESGDYLGDKNITAEQWLRDYKNAGIQCVVVSDHNTGARIDLLKTALHQLQQQEPEQWGDFTIFPGMELSCNGGVHLKVILGPDKGTADMDAIRGSVKYKGTPGDSDSVTEYSVEQVIDEIHAAGGIACAAHVDQAKGLLVSVTDHHTLAAILKKIDALEVINPSAELIQKNKADLDKFAWVLGSDSHQPEKIGRGYTWVKMSTPSYDGLRLALLDPESAIRRSDDTADNPQSFPEQWITSITLESMHLRRGHLAPLTLSFNPAYNAVIGGRGSGKSTVLECLRLGLAREGELRKVGEESEIWKTFEGFRQIFVNKDKGGMMLPDTKISVEVVKGRGVSSQRFQFVWSKQSAGFTAQVARWEDDGGSGGGGWQATNLDEAQASDFFPVKIFSQKQILALANNPQALLEHIDNSIREEKNMWRQDFESCKSALMAARLRVRTLKKELVKKPALELEYKEANHKALVFKNGNFGLLLKAFQRATQQQRAMDDFHQLLGNDIAGLQAGIEQAANLNNIALTQFLTETPAEIVAHDHAMAVKTQLVAQYEKIAAAVIAMQAQLDAAQQAQAASSWQQENMVHLQAYQNETARLKAEGINSASEAGIAVAAEERLRKQIEQVKAFEAELEQAEGAVEDAAKALSNCRESLTNARQALISQLLKQNNMLEISLRCMASTRNEVERLRGILKLGNGDNFSQNFWKEEEASADGEEIKRYGVLADIIKGTDGKDSVLIPDRIIELKRALEEMNEKRHDSKILNTSFGVPLVRRVEALSEEVFDELAGWFPEDEVILKYRPNKADALKNINQASAGQKTAAMLSFLLAYGDEPLLLDQPEDDLDNALVSALVVEQLRKNKVHRQLLVVTHNANIVVNADAELVITMTYRNGQIDLASAGGLQETTVRKDICRVMEGGEQAFRQRYKRILEDLEQRP